MEATTLWVEETGPVTHTTFMSTLTSSRVVVRTYTEQFLGIFSIFERKDIYLGSLRCSSEVSHVKRLPYMVFFNAHCLRHINLCYLPTRRGSSLIFDECHDSSALQFPLLLLFKLISSHVNTDLSVHYLLHGIKYQSSKECYNSLSLNSRSKAEKTTCKHFARVFRRGNCNRQANIRAQAFIATNSNVLILHPDEFEDVLT
jgi:hypothetical protein